MTQPCAHCGQGITELVTDGELAFCCTGCKAVYHAIHGAGLQRYYELRDGVELPPTPVEPEGLSDPSIAEQITHHEDGSCEIDLYLDGVHCAGCVWIVEKLPQVMDGVVETRLNLSRARLTIRWWPEQARLEDMGRWLGRFGYSAHPVDQSGGGTSDMEQRLLLRLGVSWALAANVMLLAITLYSGLETGLETGLRDAARWAMLVLATGAVFYGGQEFFRRAWASVTPWAGWQRLSVDVPISFGVAIGWAYSVYATITGSGEVWFDSIAVLIAALLSARFLQMRGRRKASDSAERLLSLLPSEAWLVGESGVVQVRVKELAPGDIIEVRMGDIIPVDGEVVFGQAMINRAAITGESRAEKAVPGDFVSAGETVTSSMVRVRTVAAGQNTRVGQLLNWVENAAENRAPVVQMADRLSGYFVVAVLVSALLTLLVWWQVDPGQAVAHTVALLVISCPCALGMATPLALTVGMGRAARRGIFIKHDDVLEELHRVKVVVFDKTGTLTQNDMKIVDLIGSKDALELAAALEKHSNHPLSAAFKAQSQHDVADFREEAGAGIQGIVDGKHVRVGKPDWLGACERDVTELVDRGLTPIAVEVDGAVVATLGLGDPLRPESLGIIEALHKKGIQTVLLSGDHPQIVDSVATELGIMEAHGAQTPESKRLFIESLKVRGTVAMVGDGVNDAAALQAADIGIAVHGGSDLNLVAADIFLTRPGLHAVLSLLDGAKDVIRVVRRNLTGSIIYNVLGIAAAGLGLVNPLVAAVAMPLSSLSVVLSSMIQRSFAPATSPGVQDVDSILSGPVGADVGRRSRGGVRLGGAQPPI